MDDFSGLKAGDLDGFEEYIRKTFKDVKAPKEPREVLFEDMVDYKELEDYIFGDSDDIEDTSEDKDDTFDAVSYTHLTLPTNREV